MVFAVGKCASWVDDRHFTDSCEFIEQGGQCEVNAGLSGLLASERAEEECQDAVERMDSQFAVGPMEGGTPAEVLHHHAGR